jgi:ParB family chromosome partitioning protein
MPVVNAPRLRLWPPKLFALNAAAVARALMMLATAWVVSVSWPIEGRAGASSGAEFFGNQIRRKTGPSVICGARRHWTASWLRQHGTPTFRFLVEPRELSDEEAFRIADLENRSRQDLSDVERARDYAGALSHYYVGNQGRMAERLSVSQSWLSRYLELASFPDGVIVAFGSLHAIRISHAAVLAPLLRHPVSQRAVVVEAEAIAVEQRARAGAGQGVVAAAAVVRRLAQATRRKDAARVAPRAVEYTVRLANGAALVRGTRPPRGSNLVMNLPRGAAGDRAELMRAIGEVLDRLTKA